MPRFMEGHGEQVVAGCPTDIEKIVAVKFYVTSPATGRGIKRRRERYDVRWQRHSRDAYVAKSRISLNRSGCAQRIAAVAYRYDVNIRRSSPLLKSAQNLRLPNLRRRRSVQQAK